MKYKIILQRISEHKDVQKPNNPKIEDSTLSTFTLCEIHEGDILKEIFKCFCVENIGPSTDTPNQDKRIMPRDYNLEWTDSSKNGSLAKHYPEYKAPNGRNVAILLTCDKELPSFRNRRILIHVGNYPQDTEGCLLLGLSKNDKGYISQSTDAIKKFFDIAKEIGIDNITLQVKEIKQ